MTPTPVSPEPARFRLLLVPERAAIPADMPATLRLLVRVQAPERDAADPPREPLSIALVLDRSGSMSGQPLAEARACARTIVDRLEPRDHVAVFAFDDHVECFAPPMPASQRTLLHDAIERIVEGGSTDLHGGWRAGADALAAIGGHAGLRRVVLLSDGGANAGTTDLETITGQCRDLAHAGVSTSTYGLGRSFNEELMQAMARTGRGNAYYGETSADLADPFAEEFDLLSSLCAREPVLKVSAPEGFAVRMRNDYEPAGDAPNAWRLPDLAYASEAWALVEIDLPPRGAGDAAAYPILVSLEAGARAGTPLYLATPLPPLPRVDAAVLASMPIDPLVARRLEEIDAAGVLADVRRALMESDVALAKELLARARARFAHSEWAADVLATMARSIDAREARLSAKEAMYASMKLSRRLASMNEADIAAIYPNLPRFLRRKQQQGKGEDAK